VAIGVMNWVWDCSKSRHGARLVLLAIADCIRVPGGAAWPSVPEIARKANLTERAVRAAITELASLGELAVEYNAGPKGCNRYRIATPENFAGVQSFQGEDSVPLKDFQGYESQQVNAPDPENFAPPENSSPLKNSTATPENFAGGTVREPKPSTSKRRAGDTPRGDVERICSHLADRIESNDCKRPVITQRWRDTARLMIDRDRLTEEQIHKAIDWCQDDEFWRLNIRSMRKLREHYERLRQEALQRRNGRGRMRGQGAADDLSGEEYGKGKTSI
jgi:hypothetical protein